MKLPKWAWCGLGGLVAVLPMMGMSLLSEHQQIQCQGGDRPSQSVASYDENCTEHSYRP